VLPSKSGPQSEPRITQRGSAPIEGLTADGTDKRGSQTSRGFEPAKHANYTKWEGRPCLVLLTLFFFRVISLPARRGGCLAGNHLSWRDCKRLPEASSQTVVNLPYRCGQEMNVPLNPSKSA